MRRPEGGRPTPRAPPADGTATPSGPRVRPGERDGTVVRVDVHVHTGDSHDSVETVERVLEAAARAGLDGVVVTDHDRVERSRAAADRAPEYGLVGIPGVEVSTAEGHLLGIGVAERPPPGRPLADTVARVRAAGGVAVVPHPFQRSKHGAPADAIEDVDGVEVFNAHALTGFRNRQADRFARRRGYPRFAGSDAHRAAVVGRAYTAVAVEGPPAAGTVLDAIRAGRTLPVGERIPTGRYVRKWAESVGRTSAALLGVG